MKEIFKDIKGHEGLYQISNLGRVKSFSGKRDFLSLINKPTHYCSIKLYIKNKPITCLVHRLVAQAFIPNPENKPIVNHKDGDKHNNCIDNLEWSTYTENNRHALQTGLRTPNKIILQYTKDKIFIKEFESIEQAGDETDTHKGSISEVCHNKRITAGGFVWKFKKDYKLI